MSSEVPTAFSKIRNSLIHDMSKIGDFTDFIHDNLNDYSQQSFNKVYEICFGEAWDLYSEMIEFLDDFQQSALENNE